MKQLMKKGNAGSTLIEVVIAIAILGLVSAPICSGLMVAARINARSRAIQTAQMQVSSAVEYLMANGIKKEDLPESGGGSGEEKIVLELGFSDVEVALCKETYSPELPYCEITVSGDEGRMVVNTAVKVVPAGGDGT